MSRSSRSAASDTPLRGLSARRRTFDAAWNIGAGFGYRWKRSQPNWNAVIKASCVDYEFWDAELKEPARRYENMVTLRNVRPSFVNEQASVGDLPKDIPVTSGNPGGGRGDRGLGRERRIPERRSDGRYTANGANPPLELCYQFNRHEGGCDSALSRRAHACEWCREGHPAIRCPKHPGWKPTVFALPGAVSKAGAPRPGGGGKGAKRKRA